MNRDDLYIAHILFKLKVYESDGQRYEDLFTQVMQYHNPSFRPIKPQGPIGDRKNDGFDKTNGKYYQVYAPENLQKNESYANLKLKDNFAGLYDKWEKISPIKEFFYVLNDKYKGGYPTLEKALSNIEKTYTDVKCNPFLAKDLENIFHSLKDVEISSIVGSIPNPNTIQDVDFGIMNEVVDHLKSIQKEYCSEKIPLDPDFSKKIRFNRLNGYIADLLINSNYQTHVIDDYFELNSDFIKDELQQVFISLYSEGKAFILDNPEENNVLFFYILSKACPRPTKEVRDSVMVLMAYYFECCDIYETPPKEFS